MKNEKRDKVWDEKFTILQEFVETNNRFPTRSEELNNVKIGYWLNHQKAYYRNNKLEFSRQEKLMSIGVIDQITKFDEDGNNIYTEFSDGFKVWSDYNNGILTHTIDSDGIECWYNENGDIIPTTTKDSKLYLDPNQDTNEFNIDDEYEEDDESLADKLAMPILAITLLNTLIMVYYIFS